MHYEGKAYLEESSPDNAKEAHVDPAQHVAGRVDEAMVDFCNVVLREDQLDWTAPDGLEGREEEDQEACAATEEAEAAATGSTGRGHSGGVGVGFGILVVVDSLDGGSARTFEED
jgi:hypothetical protein